LSILLHCRCDIYLSVCEEGRRLSHILGELQKLLRRWGNRTWRRHSLAADQFVSCCPFFFLMALRMQSAGDYRRDTEATRFNKTKCVHLCMFMLHHGTKTEIVFPKKYFLNRIFSDQRFIDVGDQLQMLEHAWLEGPSITLSVMALAWTSFPI
jgi:hypothetical protein